ncbi:MAG: hypothetical protein KGS09_20640 [Nitrospirae bacterium]|nr:hypothetical protein [Nitrospirota bacterium]MDE3042498.1 hypothetical protein [Nitrospirota bacterium]MDE3220872.1 hypothetical protein [Nitrospirota bacterium]
MKKDFWLYLGAIVCGVLVWAFVSATSGRREAWDSGLYFSVGMPIVCVISAAIGYFEPSRPWRWGVVPLIGQFFWMLLTQGPGNLLPLGGIVFGILSLPSIVTAQIGASLGSKREK